jgi:hypothetical protein
MFFTMSASGRVLPRFDYETRPVIGDSPKRGPIFAVRCGRNAGCRLGWRPLEASF